MKAKVFIGALLAQVLLTSAMALPAMTEHEKIAILLSLGKRRVLYDDNTPIDSVIAWSEELLPTIKASEDTHTYFMQQILLANAYTVRGDVGLATDCAQRMLDEAKERKFQFGFVLANQAIGDAYSTMDNMMDKTLESYEEAVSDLKKISPQHPYQARFLLKESKTLRRQGRLLEAQKVLERAERVGVQNFDYPLAFFFYMEKASFAVMHGHLEEAKTQLDKMDSIFQCHPEKYFRFYMNYTSAAYFSALGKQDKQYWDQAMYIYTRIQEEYSDIPNCIYIRWAALEQIRLYKMRNMSLEACKLYQELYPLIDTLASQSYVRQINTIKAKYQIGKAETANDTAYNRVFTSLLVGSLVILALMVFLAILFKKQWEKMKLSTQKLKESRVNAENATRAKSVFLSNMSHEIRTPLNALSGFSSLLTEEGLDDETRRQCNEVIQQNSELLLKLINDIIDLSNFEFGKLQLTIERHDVVVICRNVIDTVNKVKQTQADVSFTTELTEMVVETDASRLQQLLINLLINATKFTQQGSIVLNLKKESDDMLLFSVTDTGCGIPKEKQANIFQRFEKLNENIQGSGLGLSICQLIIERVGGKIWIDPEYTNGCRFCFTHPINQQERKEDAQ